MQFRVPPRWWPVVGAASPILAPILAQRTLRFYRHRSRADSVNDARISNAEPVSLPALNRFELTAVVDAKGEPGFRTDGAVSYLLRTDRGALLMDVGYGDGTETFAANFDALGLSWDSIDALLITHLHRDHMGGMEAMRSRSVRLPAGGRVKENTPVYLPDRCDAERLDPVRVDGPRLIEAGLASTGPLARMFFLLGWTEEQAVIGRLRGKGLVVVTGCGHQTVPRLLQMVQRLSDEPIHALCGGLHFPLTGSREAPRGIQLQQLVGTGKPIWGRINDNDLTETIAAIRNAGIRRLLLSPHDTCDHALDRLANESGAEAEVIHAGATYRM